MSAYFICTLTSSSFMRSAWGQTIDTSAPYEAIFFQYLFPGLLLGQIAGGLIGRVIGHPRMPPAEQLSDTIALSA